MIPAFHRLIPPASSLLLALALALAPFPAKAAEGAPALRPMPVPTTVSPELQAYISGEKKRPSASEILESVKESVSLERKSVAGVPVYLLSPKGRAANPDGPVILELHGGGFTHNGGLGGLKEGALAAHFTGMELVHPDYRLAPEHPYPAALDDAMAVYRELLKTRPASRIGVMGTSAGGSLALSLAMRARDEGLPAPGAIVAGTPWSDIAKIGDSYFANEGLDNRLIGYEGWLDESARAYAAGHDMKDPYISPIYGEVRGLPPTLLTCGTRDLFLSNTVRMHAKFREAGLHAELLVLEAMSHSEYTLLPQVPETAFYYGQVRDFFQRTLK